MHFRTGGLNKVRIGVVLLFAPLTVHAVDSPIVTATSSTGDVETTRQFLGGGKWESQRDDAGKRDWRVELKRRNDSSLVGRITVIGSAELQEARIEAQVTGDDIYGVLVDANNQQIGTFSGTVYKESLSGTYTFKNGDTGTWNWNQPLP